MKIIKLIFAMLAALFALGQAVQLVRNVNAHGGVRGQTEVAVGLGLAALGAPRSASGCSAVPLRGDDKPRVSGRGDDRSSPFRTYGISVYPQHATRRIWRIVGNRACTVPRTADFR